MSETTELRKPTLTEIEVAKKINARIAHWQGYAESSLNGQQITGLILGVLVESHLTPPSEPSEQPNAEDAEAIKELVLHGATNFHNGGLDLEFSMPPKEDLTPDQQGVATRVERATRHQIWEALKPLLQSYARHTAAKAVEAAEKKAMGEIANAYDSGREDLRQRLARLVDEKIDDVRHHPELKDFDYGYAAALKQVKSWLAGEGENT